MGRQIVDEILVRMLGDAADVARAAKEAEAALGNVAKSAKQAGSTLTKTVTLPLLAVRAAATNAAAGFEDEMTKSTAIMVGLTEDMRQAMEEQALSLSMEGKASAEELAEAYFFLASAGLDAEQQIAALPQVAAFAAAGNFDLATATDLATDAQSALGLTVKDATENLSNLTRVTDVLIKANTLANASAEQFSTALTRKAGTALRDMNKTVEEGVAVLAVYADQGIKSANAGEKLTAALRELEIQNRKNSSEFERLNIEVFRGGEMRNLADIVQDMEVAFADLSTEEKKAELAALGFRAEAMAAISPLLGYSNRLRDLQGQLEEAGGVTRDVAEKQMQSFSAQLQQTGNIINAVAIDIGQVFLPTTKDLNQELQALAKRWFELDDSTKRYIISIGGVAAAVGPALLVLGHLLSSLQAITVATRAATVAMIAMSRNLYRVLMPALIAVGAAIAPVVIPLLKIAAVGAVVVGAIAGIAYALGGPEGVAAGFNAAQSGLQTFITLAQGFFANFGENVRELGLTIQHNFVAVFSSLPSVFTAFVSTFAQFMTAIATIAVRSAAVVFGAVVRVAHDMIVGLPELIGQSFVAVVDWIGNTFRSLFTGVVSMVHTAFTAVGNIIVEAFKLAINSVWGLLTNFGTAMGKLFEAIWTGDFVVYIAQGIKEAVTKVFGFVQEVGNFLYKLVTLDFDFINQLREDARRGADGEGLAAELQKTVMEELSKIEFDMEGVDLRMPNLNLELPPTALPGGADNPGGPVESEAQLANTAAGDALFEGFKFVSRAIGDAVSEGIGVGAEAIDVIKSAVEAETDSDDMMTGPRSSGRGFSASEQGSVAAYRASINSQNAAAQTERQHLEVAKETLGTMKGIANRILDGTKLVPMKLK